jgi:uncharacterized protein (DUF983 family)
MEPERRIVAQPDIHWTVGIGRGLRCRCPACGRGRLFGHFLKVVDE